MSGSVDLRFSPAQLNEQKCCTDARPKDHESLPVVRSQSTERSDAGQDERDPLCHDSEEKLDVGINRSEGDKNGEMERT